MSGELVREENDGGLSFFARLAAARAKAAALAATRAAIFREELEEKGAQAAWAMAGFAVALFFGAFALLLATALIAALLSKLLGGPVAGVAATLALYLAIAAAGAVVGARAAARVQPLAFPATGAELARDAEVLSAAAAPLPEPEREDGEEDVEARFRAGSE